MHKLFMSVLVLTSTAFAENFEQFLDKAVTQSPYLKAAAFGIDQAKEKGVLLTRYKNPSLALEYSRFEPSTGSSGNGFRANYTQAIRLWGVGDDKTRLSEATLQSANTNFEQKRARFIRDISLLYTQYAQQKMFVVLGQEELRIAKNIYEISKSRYEAGTISRGVLLQSQVAYETIQIDNENLGLTAMQSYYALLKQAGIKQEIPLNTNYDFVSKAKTSTVNNPDIRTLYSKQKQALSQLAVNTHSIEWMNLFVEYENEPDQGIARVGVKSPLAFFNTKSQEKQIARLEANKINLLIENQNTQLGLESLKLQKQKQALKRLHNKNTKVLKTELELLKMFEEGYKIANTNLLELQDIKNKVIETKEHLIEIKTALDQNAITTNYIQGLYNE